MDDPPNSSNSTGLNASLEVLCPGLHQTLGALTDSRQNVAKLEKKYVSSGGKKSIPTLQVLWISTYERLEPTAVSFKTLNKQNPVNSISTLWSSLVDEKQPTHRRWQAAQAIAPPNPAQGRL